MSRRCGRDDGFTLVEALVAASLTLLFLGLVFGFLVPTMRVQVRGTVRSDLEQTVVVVLNRLEQDLKRASPAGISLRAAAGGPCPVALGVDRSVGLQNNAAPLWDPSAVVYCWDAQQGQLLYGQWPVPSGAAPRSAPLRLADSELLAFPTGPNRTRRILCRDVAEFEVRHADGTEGPVRPPLTLRLKLQRGVTGQQEAVTFELTRQVNPRNGL